MTAPGDFSSGDVLTAADMNALPAGLVAINENKVAQTITTSFTTYLSVTYDFVANRNYLIDAYIWMYGASTSCIAVGQLNWNGSRIQELNLDVTSSDSRRSLYQNLNYVPSSSGSATVTFVARVTAGTAGIAALPSYPNQLKIYDMGTAV